MKNPCSSMFETTVVRYCSSDALFRGLSINIDINKFQNLECSQPTARVLLPTKKTTTDALGGNGKPLPRTNGRRDRRTGGQTIGQTAQRTM